MLGKCLLVTAFVHLHCLIVIYWSSERIKAEGINKPHGGRGKGWAWVGTRHMNLTDGALADWAS